MRGLPLSLYTSLLSILQSANRKLEGEFQMLTVGEERLLHQSWV
ncbi:unnamed protein product [Heligmosomoides polygyrus]|uniref:Uncharacterized protein n=1 Tax=Heligmosomoides polygyrus TaxID=6339 RepID=A0A3P7ZAT0_HELPZ|nr:unnamed protein product [Heligmosomoides polygyrus]